MASFCKPFTARSVGDDATRVSDIFDINFLLVYSSRCNTASATRYVASAAAALVVSLVVVVVVDGGICGVVLQTF